MSNFTILFLLGILITGCTSSQSTNQYFPDDNWLSYDNVAEAGFNQRSLLKAKEYSDSLESAAVLILHDGKILANWGDATRRFRSTSIRKSLLNALIGIKTKQGLLEVTEQVGNFEIPGMRELTAQESLATVHDLLTSTSGIYLPASYESQSWTDRKPERGSYNPGEHWYYNNWDFNTLGAIYETVADSTLKVDFEQLVAKEIGMQDYRPEIDFKFFAEPGVSKIPAYLFKMSTRDLARFGLLYSRNGNWNGKQILEEEWVEKSTSSINIPWEGTGYGYLWWTTTLNDDQPIFYANGAGVQGIYVVPEMDLVMVFRANSFFGPNIDDSSALELLQMIVDAKKLPESPNPQLSNVSWIETKSFSSDDDIDASPWVGTYQNNIARRINIEAYEDGLVLKTAIADFPMYFTSNTTAWVESLEVEASLVFTETDKAGTSILSKNGLIIYK